MAKIINKGRSRVGIANARLEPDETGDVDMSAAEVRKHRFYQSGRIDLVEAKGGAKKKPEAGESASGEAGPQDGQTGESQS
jgi:hypothetical protein